ncbi:alpha-glucosidase [Paenibacillus sp. FSL K6-1122]|uniref:Alpha-glucosidase n=1 Tax=Paenibacillus amylolyticus TaxID=1451 RepID=A0ABD8AKC3_PAEAM|nr:MULTISPECIES: alpha-glucosidase [Paenibacillus]ETT36198.1 alpha amylase [Paenibacillus sp. FSL R5-192]OMF01719.1 glucohydrolase [Paenibacillus amylolyticus]
MENKKWWKETVVYQIYPRSFQDRNGDGIGDLEGIVSRLDYLQQLGIGAIWLSPVCKSPQDDFGYDISDYQDIDPMFGSLEDMETLIQEAGKRDIRIIMDLVLNHTSDEHSWFQEAKKGKDNPYHDYYVWRDGVEGTPPNDLGSTFGGSAWEWVPEIGQYYLHLFSVKQPDLNWENPKVRQEIYNMINWWIDKGVGGFRLDVIDLIGKEPDLKITGNGPNLHKYIRELSKETFQKAEDLLTVGETWGATPEIAKLYSNPDGSEFSMVFQFEHISLDEQEGKGKWDLKPLDVMALKKVLSKWQTELKGDAWNSLFWNNHDLPRIVSRWGNDGEFRVESAKMLATLLHGMQGTPYIYQGEELGMTNFQYAIEDYRDIELLNFYKERMGKGYPEQSVMESIYAKGRDNARTPMQWDTSDNSGFTQGEPWIKVNPNYKHIHAEESLNNPESIFHYYRKLIQLRKDHEVIVYGDYELIFPENPDVFAYTRTLNSTTILVVCNFQGYTTELPLQEQLTGSYQLLIANYTGELSESELRPYEARMYLIHD